MNDKVIRGMRAVLNWTQKDLAEASGLSMMTIKKMEKGASNTSTSALNSVMFSFSESGVTSSCENGKCKIEFAEDLLAK